MLSYTKSMKYQFPICNIYMPAFSMSIESYSHYFLLCTQTKGHSHSFQHVYVPHKSNNNKGLHLRSDQQER